MRIPGRKGTGPPVPRNTDSLAEIVERASVSHLLHRIEGEERGGDVFTGIEEVPQPPAK